MHLIQPDRLGQLILLSFHNKFAPTGKEVLLHVTGVIKEAFPLFPKAFVF